MRAGLLGIALASAGATSSFALVGDVVVNGDFEAGNTGFTSTYGYTVPGGNVGGISGNLLPEQAYTVDSNPSTSHSLWGSFADHTPGVGNQMLIVNGGDNLADFVWKQTVNVTPGLTYFFEA